jgi:ferric-dicitrate binding protein FerR (iron transport regulator)
MAEQTPDNNRSVDIEALLKRVGSRTTPDTDLTAKSKAKVHQHWQQMVQKQKQQRKQRFVWAMAASVLVVFTVSLLTINQPFNTTAAQPFAVVQNLQGTVEFQNGDQWLPLDSSTKINSSTLIRTAANSHLNIQLNDNSELRIAANTSLLTGNDSIELNYGQIYHDTDVSEHSKPLTIKTSQADINHIGTRYLVSNQDNVVKVAVRSGQVNFKTQDNNDVQSIESEQLATLSSSGENTISAINSYDKIWDWTFVAQSGYSLNNKSLYEFVQWYARQNGLTVDWQNFESPSKRVRLQGDIQNMTAEQAINTVFYATQYTYSIDQGVLQIKQQNQ